MPQREAAYKIAGWLEGVHKTTSRQAAICAGIPNISTVENNGAVPPGIYTPTFSIPTVFLQQVTPLMVSIFSGVLF